MSKKKGLLGDLFARKGKHGGGLFPAMGRASRRRRKKSGTSPLARLGGSVKRGFKRRGGAAGDVFLKAGGMERYFKMPKSGRGRSWWDRFGERITPMIREDRADDDGYNAYAREERVQMISDEIADQETLNQWERQTELMENDRNIIRRIINAVRRRLEK